MAVVDIALLGPLEIRGEPAGLSPRDRTVLSVLALSAGRVVSAERLADALWGESAPLSWNKVVPGCVMRLRRMLGAEAIETRSPGYRLTLASDGIDFRRFERLLGRGRELLAVGEPERASYTLDEALGLWRGTPLVDLAEWEPGRIEAERLGELHLEAQECRVDAALRSGRPEEVIADAQRRVAECPLRERRWALLAQAQYQAGQQGAALRTLHRARTVLVSELGLDPGADLLALENAIRHQDPGLAVQSADSVVTSDCPWPGLVPYGVGDADAFFGRDREITECLDRLAATRILLITGPSGSGKSSLARAGLTARFLRGGSPVVITPGADPLAALGSAPLPAGELLVVDQAEELFTITTDADVREEFLEGLARHSTRGPLVVVLRADHVGQLAAFPRFARLAERELYLLGALTGAGLRAAIERPAQQAGLLLEPGLVDLLVRDVEDEPGALPLLSHALQRTWECREGRVLTVAGYHTSGGIRGSVAQAAEQLYQSLPLQQRTRLRQLLLRLVSATDDNDAIRVRVPRTVLAGDPDRERLLDALTAARLITTDRDSVELSHECLARAWPRLRGWLDDDIEGRRILRHVSSAAQTWDAMGRLDSELYRGIRLTQTLAWVENTGPDLTSTERDFLSAAEQARDAETRAAEEAAHARIRSRRRAQVIVGATTALVVIALVAAGLAVRQQQARAAADLAALVAETSRIDETARSANELDQALLYAVQAVRIIDTPETRTALLNLLSQHPDLIRSVRTGPVQSIDISPDGTRIVVGTEDNTIVYDAVTYLPDRDLDLGVGSSAAEFSPDGRKIAVSNSGVGYSEPSSALSALAVDMTTSTRRPLTLEGVNGNWVYAADISYSGDGRRMAAYAVGIGDRTGADTSFQDAALAVWNESDLNTPLAVIHRACWAIAMSPDGTRLYIGTAEEQPTLAVVDIGTRQTLYSTSVPRARILADVDHPSNRWTEVVNGIQVSPDGTTVAVAEGSIIGLYEAGTLAPLGELRKHTGTVRTLEFSADGRYLASGADDGLAVVWDVASKAPIAVESGGPNPVRAVAFAPDGRTLYSGGDDQQLLVWDLDGDRRFLTVVADPDGIRRSAAAVPAPDGATVVTVGHGVSEESGVRFLDVGSASLGPPQSNPGGSDLAVWIPPDYGRVATTAGAEIRIWDRAGGRRLLGRVIGDGDITALSAPTATVLIAADADGTVVRLDPASLDPTGPAISLDHRVAALTGRADGRTAIALLDDQRSIEVDLETGRALSSRDLGLDATAAAVSPDGTHLALGGKTGQAGLFDLDSGAWINTPAEGRQLYVTSIQFAADGASFVTSTVDGRVALWDGATGTLIGQVAAGTVGSPARAVILPGGDDVLIATRDRAVFRWDANPEDWLTYACQVAGRNLTPSEWHAVLESRPYASTCTES